MNMCLESMSLILRTLKLELGDAVEVHCSRERSRAAWKIIEEVLGRNVHEVFLILPAFSFLLYRVNI